MGSVVWDCDQYALGLERLVWDVYCSEDNAAEACDLLRGEYGNYRSQGRLNLPTVARRRQSARPVNAQCYSDMFTDVSAHANTSTVEELSPSWTKSV